MVLADRPSRRAISRSPFELAFANSGSAWCDNINTEEIETFDEMVLKSFLLWRARRAVDYGRVHRGRVRAA